MEKINPYENKPGTHWERSCFDRGFRQGARAGYLKAIEALRGDDADKFWREHPRCMHLGWADFLESKIDEVLR